MADQSSDESDVATKAAKGPPGRRVWLLVALLVVGNVVLASLWLSTRSDRDDLSARFDELREEAEAVDDAGAVATEFLDALFNWDAATVDADFDRVLSFAAGDFLEQADDFQSTEVRRTIRERQASSRGEVVDLFLQGAGEGRVHFFAVVDQTIANIEVGPTVDTVRAELTVQRDQDGDWKIVEMTILQAPLTIVPDRPTEDATDAS